MMQIHRQLLLCQLSETVKKQSLSNENKEEDNEIDWMTDRQIAQEAKSEEFSRLCARWRKNKRSIFLMDQLLPRYFVS